jgi:murein L,D-transpeptidase YcbB/YkuD
VPLGTPIPVIVFHTTAIVDESGDRLFLLDVYAHDDRLGTALAHRTLAR